MAGFERIIALAFGGRAYAGADRANWLMTAVHRACPIRLLMEGGAPGADELCRKWADANKVPGITIDAIWERRGKPAGPRRNRGMARAKPDLAIMFPGGIGTRDMLGVCVENDIPVISAALAFTGICDGCGTDGIVWPCNGAPLANGAICVACIIGRDLQPHLDVPPAPAL